MNQIPNIEEEKEEIIEPDKVFDCFDEGCEECTVCKYLNFREWAEGCAPAGSSIERNQLVEDYLKRKHQQLQKVHHDWLREEIVRLEGMKYQQPLLGTQETTERVVFAVNDTLQTIIDRYQAELDQEVGITSEDKTNGF